MIDHNATLPSSLVSALINETGLAPFADYPAWGRLVELAQAITATITLPEHQVLFAAQAVIDLKDTSPEEAAQINSKHLAYLTDFAWSQRPTPRGSTELWGSAFQ